MKRDHEPPAGSLLGNRGDKPDLRELTISMGRSDIYVNLARTVEMDNGHTLFEAILTDDNGSRVIYVDREDIAECLRESFLLTDAPPEEKS
ncbi:MAG: hypothetical protein HYT80_07730 [Euryarchaeota archaeon]|nr:hypothetical protein [Euryarchaeota archaeon]